MSHVEDSVFISSEETTKKFKNILESNGILEEVSDVIVKDAGLKSEGFASQTHYVTVVFKNSSVKPLNLFVKTETTNASHTKFLDETKLFEKECTFFMKYIPALTEFCRSKCAEDLVNIYPKCYFGDGEHKMVVLENLVLDRGFELLERTCQHGFEAARLTLITLAKHHAMSHAYMSESGGAEEFFKRFPTLDFDSFDTDVFNSMLASSIENSLATNIKILQKSQVENKDDIIKIMKEKCGKLWEFLLGYLRPGDPDDDTFLVLNHGDFHSNNMLFNLDKETNEPIKHIAVDFQVSRYVSPALDISLYLYSSVKPEVRRDRLRDLLKIYLDVLNSTTERLGYPTSLNFEEMFRLYCKKVSFGIWFAGMFSVSSAGARIAKEIDITKLDMKDIVHVVNDYTQKWLDSNPEACRKAAEKIMELLGEYKELVLEQGFA